MNKLKSVRINKYAIYYLGVTLLIIYLAFKGLDNNYFWDDESETAIFAKNFLNYRTLTAWDGNNLLAYRNGAFINDDFTSLEPPLRYYITSISFAFFDKTTFYARLPFVIIGLFSLLFLYFILKDELGNKNTILYALIIFGLSTSFLLFIRQAQYSSFIIFLPLVIYYYYKKYIKTEKKIFLVYLTSALTALFYSQYLICIIFVGVLAIDYFLFYFRKKTFIPITVAFAAFALLAMPIIITNKLFNLAPNLIEKHGTWIFNKLILLYRNFRETNSLGFLPVTIFIGLLIIVAISVKNKHFLGENKKHITFIKEWLLMIFAFILLLSFLTTQTAYNTFIADIRYLIVILPFASGLVSVFLFFVGKKSKMLALAFLLLVVLTNLLSIPLYPSRDIFHRQIRFDLINYIKEIHNDYVTPYEAMAEFLQQNAKQDDIVFVSPDYMGYPLMFYAGDKFKLCCQLSYTTKLPKDNVHQLDKNLFLEEAKPKWLILFGRFENTPTIFSHFTRDGSKYKPFKYINIFWRDMTRPELLWHSYGPVADFNQTYQGIYVYKKEENI